MAHDNMDDRLDEEVQFHIDMQTEQNIRKGMTPEEARRKALLEFGGRDRWRDEARSEYKSRALEGTRRDFVFGIRSLLRQRGFALTAIITLALGIGSSTAIFSVVNAVLLRSLPYPHPQQLALVWGDMHARKVTDFPFSPPNFKDLKEKNQSFEDLASVTPFDASVTFPGQPPEQVKALGVTTNLLSVLGVKVQRGRDFIPDDGVAPAPPPQPAAGQPPAPQPPPPPAIIVISNGYWQRRFGGDPKVLNSTVDFFGGPGQIVGILPADFEVLFPPNTNIEPHPDMLVAQRTDFERSSRLNVFMRVIGKLKPGVTPEAATRDVERICNELREQYQIMKTADTHWRVESMHEDLVHDVRPAIFALMGAVTFVLLIACANVANLLFVRAAARERELAIRAAMGSSPWRIVRQLLAESLVLALSGALLGVGLAWAGIKVLVALSPANLPRLDDVHIDPWVLLFATLAAIVAAAIFGVVPALRASRPDLADVLRASGRTPSLGAGKVLRNGVVMAEVALSFVLLVGGGLMIRSFVELTRLRPGFDPNGLLTFTIGGGGGRSDTSRAAFMQVVQQKLAAIPGVKSATSVFPIPLNGQLVNSRWGGEEAASDPSKFQQANLHIVLPGYFATMGTRVIAGRVYTEADNRADFTGIVIDDILARKAFPGTSPIGKRLYVRSRGQTPEWLDVIGVVEHQRHESLTEEQREAIFFTDGFFGHGRTNGWVLRVNCPANTSCDPTSVASAARKVIADVDATIPVANMKPMQDYVDRAMTPTRFALVLISVFAGVAVILACVGLYGVLSTAVRQRTAEIGVRVAFGATKRNIFGLVVGDGMKLSVAGIVIGLIGAFWLTRAMQTMLVGVTPTDLPTYVLMVLLFLIIAALACFIPARRAASLDPTNALRSE